MLDRSVERAAFYALQWGRMPQLRPKEAAPVLRMLFGEPPGEWVGAPLVTVQAIERFIKLAYAACDRSKDEHQKQAFQKYGIWAEGLLRSMDELEQSCYAAKKYAGLIHRTRADELSPAEKSDYYRHVYYDKNAYIRVFALLDKLGTLLNELLELRTERMKPRFSYFTVLRNMRLNHLHTELMKPLDELKEQYRAPLNRLRNRRNTEIHYMNAELQDDLRMTLERHVVWRKLEDLKGNMADLDCAWKMIESTLGHCFRYACKRGLEIDTEHRH